MAHVIAILCGLGAAAIGGIIWFAHGRIELSALLERLAVENERVELRRGSTEAHRRDLISPGFHRDQPGGDFQSCATGGTPSRSITSSCAEYYVVFTREVGDENNVLEIQPMPTSYRCRRCSDGEWSTPMDYSTSELRSFLQRAEVVTNLSNPEALDQVA